MLKESSVYGNSIRMHMEGKIQKRRARRVPGYVNTSKLLYVTPEVFIMLRDKACSVEEFTKMWQTLSATLRSSIVVARNEKRRQERLELQRANKREAAVARQHQKAQAVRKEKSERNIPVAKSKIPKDPEKAVIVSREDRILELEEQLLTEVKDIRQRIVDPAQLIPIRIDARTVVHMRPDRDPKKVISTYTRLSH